MHNTRIQVTGVPVDNIDMAGAVAYAKKMLESKKQCRIFAMNPEKAVAALNDEELYQCLNSAELLIADGIGVVLASRLQGIPFKERVPGSELMPRLCEMAAREGYGVFLFGAKEDVNRQAAQKLKETYPSLVVSGRHDGYINEENTPKLIKQINDSGAKLLFVALGSPKQENWMNQNKDQLNVLVMQGVGGTFDVISGNVKRAPAMWRMIHLEWLYRLFSQPKRLFRQSRLPAYAWLILSNGLSLKRK